MSPSTTTCCGSRAKTTTPVPDRSLPTGVAVSTSPILSAQLPTVTVASVLWVPWILKGQALRLPLQTAALCAGEWEKGRGLQLGTGRANWQLHPLLPPHPQGSGPSTAARRSSSHN